MQRWVVSRREIARAYAAATSQLKAELLRRAVEEGEEALREAKGALRDLNGFGGRRVVELERWLAEYDGPETVREEFAPLSPWLPQEVVPRGERVVGGPAPEWLRKWAPVVCEWWKERKREEGIGYEEVLRELVVEWGSGVREMVEKEGPFRRTLVRVGKSRG